MDICLYDGLSELLQDTGIAYRRLSCSEGKCLVLFYRPGELKDI